MSMRGFLARAAVASGLVMASLVFCGIALEAGLRAFGYPWREMRFVCYDPIMGNVYCPGVQGPIAGFYGVRQLRTNADGAADRDYPALKPAGTYRVALLGDSIVASLYLDPAERLDKLWEASLPRLLGRRVEVMNFGVQGTGTW
ncbi:MAG: hypothetical protein AB1452_10310, partial [Pseudomonadota bacterium]